MKTITFRLFALLIISLVLSCSKDDEGEDRPLQTLLSKSVTPSQTTTYSYDSNNRATGFSVVFSDPTGNYSGSYSYNDSGQLAEVFYDAASTTEDSKSIYFYNTNGQIIKIETYAVSGGVATLQSTSEADYGTNGKVSVYDAPSGGSSYLTVEYFLDADGNTTRQQSYDPAGILIVTTENSDFDDKHASSLSLPQTGFVRNVNNYGTVTVTPTGGSPNVGTYTYEYNSDDYPTKRTTNTGSVVTYEYIKR